jgi:NAD dependent epimerase/dehydratase family
VVADVMVRESLLGAVRDVRADAVMHQLTALGTRRMGKAVQGTNALRTTGTAHLLAAARAVGAHRFLTQSIVFGYGFWDHGPHLITEDDPFGEPAPGRIGTGIAAIRSTEQQVFSADEMEGIALRYGAFYGQDSVTRMITNLVRKRRLPVPSSGGGFVTFIYLDDDAAATVAALEKGPRRTGLQHRRRRADPLGRLPRRARGRTRSAPTAAGAHLDAAPDPVPPHDHHYLDACLQRQGQTRTGLGTNGADLPAGHPARGGGKRHSGRGQGTPIGTSRTGAPRPGCAAPAVGGGLAVLRVFAAEVEHVSWLACFLRRRRMTRVPVRMKWRRHLQFGPASAPGNNDAVLPRIQAEF